MNNPIPQAKTVPVYSKSEKMVIKSLQLLSKINPWLGAQLGVQIFQTPLKRKIKDEAFPKGTKQIDFKYGSHSIRTYRYGDSHRKVLLVHGWEGGACDLSKFYEPLAQNGFEVISLDLPGHGHSSFAQLNAFLVSDLIRGLDLEFGPFTGIVGHSFGGLSTAFARFRFQELRDLPIVTIGSPNKLKDILVSYASVLGLTPTQRQFIASKLEQKFNFKVEQLELGKFLSRTNAKSLVIHDELDRQVPIHAAKAITEETERPEFYFTHGLGHNRILRNDKVIEKALDFIKTNQDCRESFHEALRFGLV